MFSLVRGIVLLSVTGLALVGAALRAPAWAQVSTVSVPMHRVCGAPHPDPLQSSPADFHGFLGSTDCDENSTNPESAYADGGLYEFRVVFHILQSADGQNGAVSDELVRSQLQVLNEDFQALADTPGAGGVNTRFGFALADTDPNGAPTTGILRYNNDEWFQDQDSYWTKIAWDTRRYINVYTSEADGLLGYAFPPAGSASRLGKSSDRVVIHWSATGRVSANPNGFDLGRTLTHELGHYFGLLHTFSPNSPDTQRPRCAASEAPACFRSGDLICDTPSEGPPSESCLPKATCGFEDPVDNYMNYSPDVCMTRFTLQQALRMRCTAATYRPEIHWPSATLALASGSVLSPANDVTQHSVRLKNSGSVAAQFQVSLQHHRGETWAAGFSSEAATELTTALLSPGESVNLPLWVAVPGGALHGAFSELSVTAVTSENRLAESLILRTEVSAVGALAWRVPPNAHAQPEVLTTLPVVLRNGAAVDDTVSLSLPDWAGARFARSQTTQHFETVPAFSEIGVDVEVSVPPSAGFGTVYSFPVLASTSLLGPEVEAELALYVDASNRGEITPPQVKTVSVVGAQLVQRFAFQNQGNRSGEFVLSATHSGGVLGVSVRPDRLGPLAPFGNPGDLGWFDVVVDVGPGNSASSKAQLQITARSTRKTDLLAQANWEIAVAEQQALRWVATEPWVRLDPGESGGVHFELINDGTIHEQIAITVEDPSRLLVNPLPPAAELHPGERLLLVATLQAPRDAASGQELPLIVHAQSRTLPSVTSQLELGVNVSRVAGGKPGPGRGPRDAGMVGASPSDAGHRSSTDAASSLADSGAPASNAQLRRSGCTCTTLTAPRSTSIPLPAGLLLLAFAWVSRRSRNSVVARGAPG